MPLLISMVTICHGHSRALTSTMSIFRWPAPPEVAVVTAGRPSKMARRKIGNCAKWPILEVPPVSAVGAPKSNQKEDGRHASCVQRSWIRGRILPATADGQTRSSAPSPLSAGIDDEGSREPIIPDIPPSSPQPAGSKTSVIGGRAMSGSGDRAKWLIRGSPRQPGCAEIAASSRGRRSLWRIRAPPARSTPAIAAQTRSVFRHLRPAAALARPRDDRGIRCHV